STPPQLPLPCCHHTVPSTSVTPASQLFALLSSRELAYRLICQTIPRNPLHPFLRSPVTHLTRVGDPTSSAIARMAETDEWKEAMEMRMRALDHGRQSS
ncbi:unnamed protein product, partial [Closterium sp. Naga37s-1]